MAEDYPYMISNNKIKQIFDAILQAAKPPKFSHEVLKKLGFSSSNDRAFIPLFRRLGFINENGVPTEHYDDLKDKTKREYALGERIKDLYSELYNLNTEIHNASEDDIKGAMGRVTGKDSKAVARFYATFKSLTPLAKFDGPQKIKKASEQEKVTGDIEPPTALPKFSSSTSDKKAEFHYNIQIHLPATTEIAVYNAIFKSLRESLG